MGLARARLVASKGAAKNESVPIFFMVILHTRIGAGAAPTPTKTLDVITTPDSRRMVI
jgi:hypothetical protein